MSKHKNGQEIYVSQWSSTTVRSQPVEEKKRSYNSCIIEIDLDCDTLESGGINETKTDLYRIYINSKVIKCKRIERIGKLDENIMHDKGFIGGNPQSIHLLLDPLHFARRKGFINFEIA